MPEELLEGFQNIKEQYDKFMGENFLIDDSNIEELLLFIIEYLKIMDNAAKKLQDGIRLKYGALRLKAANGMVIEEVLRTMMDMDMEFDENEKKLKEMMNNMIKFEKMSSGYFNRKVVQVRREAEAGRDAEDSNNPGRA